MYPANVTTGSSQGVTDYAAFYPVLAEMERWLAFAPRKDPLCDLSSDPTAPVQGSPNLMNLDNEPKKSMLTREISLIGRIWS